MFFAELDEQFREWQHLQCCTAVNGELPFKSYLYHAPWN